MNTGHRRLFIASALLLVLFTVVFVIDELLALYNSMPVQALYASSRNDEGTNEELNGKLANPESFYSTMIEQYKQSLPEVFQEELFEIEEMSEYFVGADSRVVGIRFKSNASETSALLFERMKEKGWTTIKSGSATQSSFVKSFGHYSYAFLECFDDSSGCLAVITLGLREEE